MGDTANEPSDSTLTRTYCYMCAQPVETHFYNRDTSSYFVRHFELSGGLPLYTRSQTLVARCPLPVTRCPLPVARCPLPVARCPLPVARCPLPVARCPLPVARCPLPVARSPFTVPRSPFPVPRSPFLVLVTSLRNQLVAQQKCLLQVEESFCEE